jgi:predicted nucleic acid-binding protein
MSFVYIDTSVALAQLLAEDRIPPDRLWKESLISSRLLEYEIWNRIHARKLGKSHADSVQELTGRIALIELVAPVLERAKEPFLAPVRTLDALHLASISFLIDNGQTVTLASYDAKMIKAARSIGIEIYEVN